MVGEEGELTAVAFSDPWPSILGMKVEDVVLEQVHEVSLGSPARCPFSPLFWLGGIQPTKIDYRKKGVPLF